jgi:hypothetical protein
MEKDEKHGVNPQNASHNLDARLDDQSEPPDRDVVEADFAAEAHGFTAYEKTGQGSSYEGGALDDGESGPDGSAKASPLETGLATPAGRLVLQLRWLRHAILRKVQPLASAELTTAGSDCWFFCSGMYKAEHGGAGCSLRAVRGIELSHGACNILVDRIVTDVQPVANLLR